MVHVDEVTLILQKQELVYLVQGLERPQQFYIRHAIWHQICNAPEMSEGQVWRFHQLTPVTDIIRQGRRINRWFTLAP